MISNLTHWGRVTHKCVSKSTIIGSDNGLSPGWRQAIIWTNAGILSIGPLGTNFSEILIEILTFWFKKMHLKMSSAKWRPFCLRLNVLLTQSTLAYWCMCLAAMVITGLDHGCPPIMYIAISWVCFLSIISSPGHSSAAEIWSPGCQMRPMNPPGTPSSHHRWSVWWPMNSWGFEGNILEWNWTYDSTDIMWPFVLMPK